MLVLAQIYTVKAMGVFTSVYYSSRHNCNISSHIAKQGTMNKHFLILHTHRMM